MYIAPLGIIFCQVRLVSKEYLVNASDRNLVEAPDDCVSISTGKNYLFRNHLTSRDAKRFGYGKGNQYLVNKPGNCRQL